MQGDGMAACVGPDVPGPFTAVAGPYRGKLVVVFVVHALFFTKVRWRSGRVL